MQELRGLLQYALEDEQPLHEFLAEQSLVADVDSLNDDNNAVTLMTLHSAKGLEFPVVFITGLETGILPHVRSFEEVGGIEEERRLFYVGVTRAKDHLYLSYAFRRALYSGTGGIASPSDSLPICRRACSKARRQPSPACAAFKASKRRRSGQARRTRSAGSRRT